VKRGSDRARDRTDADIPSNVTFELLRPEAEILEAPRQIVPGVVGNDDQRRTAARVGHRDRARSTS
jgi:hypothetical protein